MASLENSQRNSSGVALQSHSRVIINDEKQSATVRSDLDVIQALVRAFFGAFTSGTDSSARLDALRAMFVPEAVIVRTCGGEPVVYGVDGFIAPRRQLLQSGSLVGFSEWEVSGRTEVFGDIAQNFGSYAKAGVQDGTVFTARGMKTLQFVRAADGWRITALAWDDERVPETIEKLQRSHGIDAASGDAGQTLGEAS